MSWDLVLLFGITIYFLTRLEVVSYKYKRLKSTVASGGYYIDSCRGCGVEVLTIPEGLSALCTECAEKEMEEQ